ncbi:glycoside hydrolase family 47 protein [Thozetella sp. PMI_491]|nr:glycoside hydrolase family 47 protein [Thozetella sp. PMI_491]
MSSDRIAILRQQTIDMFYHGFDNYMAISFPEDELRPVSCLPLTRDAKNPRNVELNDVLGNYSLTLIDSLSTLAILASAPLTDKNAGPKSLRDFQDGVAALVQQYGDGRPGPSGQGLRSRGFDLDSKVQVFETVIRGVGGLLSAHLFAVGELPIAGYKPPRPDEPGLETPVIYWSNGFKYDGQLLRLALDLAQRLLPAFYSKTGMPYPRVNLRHGIPFYTNSPLHETSPVYGTEGGPPEITETCSAGAGSLVLEFTVLSRLTGDERFEQLAKRAFWAVWYRKSQIGLIGAGVDAENGHWIGPFAVIGAGADSFFEYALKSHILLSGQDLPNRTTSHPEPHGDWLNPNALFHPLSDAENSADSFLDAWHQAHSAIKRHLYSDREHPHYENVNLYTGSLASNWVDSLGAYYSGLLTLAGEVEEAIETSLLYTAIWTKYSALPERWSIKDKTVEGGLGWWPLRPEFIESTYHLYRATEDPWYLYVGEMVQRDINRRCWTKCGFSGLQNVLDGEHSDRMESFFLGETAKYMYLLYDDKHPLNSLDAAFVFTTEGHPLIIPKKDRQTSMRRKPGPTEQTEYMEQLFTTTCPAPSGYPPLTGSAIAARDDIYHAARMLDLHLMQDYQALLADVEADQPGDDRTPAPSRAPGNFFPRTLPAELLPDNGICAKVYEPVELTLEFASNTQQVVDGASFNFLLGQSTLDRLAVDRIRVTSLSGLKLTMRMEDYGEREWRVTKLNGVPLGRDEFAVMDRAILGDVSDSRFNLVRDPVVVKLQHLHRVNTDVVGASEDVKIALEAMREGSHSSARHGNVASLVKSLFSRMVASLDRASPRATSLPGADSATLPFDLIINQTAITAVGVGAAALPPTASPSPQLSSPAAIHKALLPWTAIYEAGACCNGTLPEEAARDHQVILMRRGKCSFSEKLAAIPAHKPSAASLQLVVIVSHEEDDKADYYGYAAGNPDMVRPLLDDVQHTPAGIPRRHPIPMVMVGGGEISYRQLSMAERIGLTRRHYIESQGLRVRNIIIDEGELERTL